jgi:hypothetical protein
LYQRSGFLCKSLIVVPVSGASIVLGVMSPMAVNVEEFQVDRIAVTLFSVFKFRDSCVWLEKNYVERRCASGLV